MLKMKKESEKITSIRKIMEANNDSPEQIEATLGLIAVNEKNNNQETVRSWLSLLMSFIAIVISILVAIFK